MPASLQDPVPLYGQTERSWAPEQDEQRSALSLVHALPGYTRNLNPVRRHPHRRDAAVQRWAPPLSRVVAGLRACSRAAARPLPFWRFNLLAHRCRGSDGRAVSVRATSDESRATSDGWSDSGDRARSWGRSCRSVRLNAWRTAFCFSLLVWVCAAPCTGGSPCPPRAPQRAPVSRYGRDRVRGQAQRPAPKPYATASSSSVSPLRATIPAATRDNPGGRFLPLPGCRAPLERSGSRSPSCVPASYQALMPVTQRCRGWDGPPTR